MDGALAAQMGEAVAEKVLRYRRDRSGWKICQEGVSEELGGEGTGVPEAPGLLLSLLSFALQPLELD